MKLLSRLEFLYSKVSGVDVSIVWSHELQKLLKENDELLTNNNLLAIENEKLKDEIATLKQIQETTQFVRLYA